MGKRLTVVASLAVLALLLLLATTFAHEKRPQAPVVASLERPAGPSLAPGRRPIPSSLRKRARRIGAKG